jgi:hypothetical protein
MLPGQHFLVLCVLLDLGLHDPDLQEYILDLAHTAGGKHLRPCRRRVGGFESVPIGAT